MQNLVQNADYLVCLSVETTASNINVRRIFATPQDRLSQLSGGAKQETAPVIADFSSFLAQNGASAPRVIHLDWCVCSVKDFKVLESANAVVNPGLAIDAQTAALTRVTQDAVSAQGVSLAEAIEKVSEFCPNKSSSRWYHLFLLKFNPLLTTTILLHSSRRHSPKWWEAASTASSASATGLCTLPSLSTH